MVMMMVMIMIMMVIMMLNLYFNRVVSSDDNKSVIKESPPTKVPL